MRIRESGCSRAGSTISRRSSTGRSAAPQQSYPALLDWWIAAEHAGTSRVAGPRRVSRRRRDSSAFAIDGDSRSDSPDQNARGEERVTSSTTRRRRSRNRTAPSRRSLATLYASRALVPGVPWLDSTAPAMPTVSVSSRTVQMIPAEGELPRWWVVRSRSGNAWATRVVFGDQRSFTLGAAPDRVLLTAIDQAGNASVSAGVAECHDRPAAQPR